jgi:radical SAM superfamily enzyme YgiQ (UPF0313 family)
VGNWQGHSNHGRHIDVRKLALVCASPPFDGGEMPLPMPSYGIHRVHAAARSGDYAHPVDVRFFDLGEMGQVEGLKAILDFAPDLVGFSVYVWSMANLLQCASDLRAKHPGALFVFGGPSARRDTFDHPYYRQAGRVVDAVCEGDGEAVIQHLMRLPKLDLATLAATPGLWTRRDSGSDWHASGALLGMGLGDVPSPYQLGMMPEGAVAYLETYRGCPLSCNFCAWGVTRPAREVFPTEYIEAELNAFRTLRAPAVFLLDAGLNLNSKGFRNLAEARSRNGFLSEALLWAEIYPTMAKPAHLEFLASVGTAYLGVGLQSTDERVLKAHNRPFDMRRFAPAVEELSKVAGLEIQIIMGLPEDTPEGFRKTLEYALMLPVSSVRVYHCLVLPDALLSRAEPSWNIDFAPDNMAMVSNNTWSSHDLESMRDELTNRVAKHGGAAGEYWWSFRK